MQYGQRAEEDAVCNDLVQITALVAAVRLARLKAYLTFRKQGCDKK